jgi:hypothetical protein
MDVCPLCVYMRQDDHSSKSSPTDRGASLYVIKRLLERGGYSPRCSARKKKILLYVSLISFLVLPFFCFV